MGRFSAIAKGARKSTKRFGGALEPFALFEATLSSSRRGSSLYTLTEASLQKSHDGLSQNLTHLGVAAFLIELLREIAPEHDSSSSLFDVCQESLGILDTDAHICAKALMLGAGMRILAQSGFGISVQTCNACGTKVPPHKSVFFDALRGGVVCTPCGGGPILLDSKAITDLIFLSTHPISDCAHTKLSSASLNQLESVFETFINVHLEKKLKTPSFMDQVSP